MLARHMSPKIESMDWVDMPQNYKGLYARVVFLQLLQGFLRFNLVG